MLSYIINANLTNATNTGETMSETLRAGIDIGSTTIKMVAIDSDNRIVYKAYERHMSSVSRALKALLDDADAALSAQAMRFNFTGSAGLRLAKYAGAQFTQEVIAASSALRMHAPDTDVCIELGGEDAKIMFFEGDNIEMRMNGTCAGGTGAFIDQMATLLDTDASGLNKLAKSYEKLYDIASRCGVFAKTDIQPLLNQGAAKSDIAASIFQAIVNQTVGGLSQGKKIRGRVAFLGGPLTFSSELRKRFTEFLHLENPYLPDHGEVFVAYGAALEADREPKHINELMADVERYRLRHNDTVRKTMEPLFASKADYEAFRTRHAQADVPRLEPSAYEGDAFLGIDAGSTTTKLVLLTANGEVLFDFYRHNRGKPIEAVKDALHEMHAMLHPGIVIRRAMSTGYGEALIKHAFSLDDGEVETICHYEAAKYFDPEVSFVVDIGGQDMKCFKIDDGVISSIVLNEACSSGCGSFVETFAESLGHSVEAFAGMAVDAEHPVDLGSRCTVFMNSSVKQAQSEAATNKDISAGLAVSVVKNALYKVIRAHDVRAEYGEHILVQGGTFQNDAVLRSFERETGVEVVRPRIAHLMGAFGAALIARKRHRGDSRSTMLDEARLKAFSYGRKRATCHRCHNLCALTINIFNDGEKYISGNRCEKGAGINVSYDDIPNLYLYKYDKIMAYEKKQNLINPQAKVGLPMIMNMYENAPFWQPFFEALNVEVTYSDRSTKALYERGQDSIPSDTICYPAKLAHGHIESLYEKAVDFIFYPNMPFNFDESGHAHNHYNCPVVAHYPEVINANLDHLDMEKFLQPYVTLNDKTAFVNAMAKALKPFVRATKKELKQAYDTGIKAYKAFRQSVQKQGDVALEYARKNDLNVIVLAGRPYHIDPEVNHGIPKLIRSLNVVVISEDALNHRARRDRVDVLNQWTYHTRLYDVAEYVATLDNRVNLVQLVSFGCGIDAITTDEVKTILERNHKLYTQIKIDEISNLGAVNIRLRSLLSTMEGAKNHG